MATLDECGEDVVVEALCSQLSLREDVVVGPGDDCAVTQDPDTLEPDIYDLLKTDTVIEGVHYTPDTAPERVGWKALMRNVSDIVAMGGFPKHAVISITVPGKQDLTYLEKLYAGLQKAAKASRVSIVGGETSRSPDKNTTVISVALTGKVHKLNLTLRSGAKTGDVIAVTGTLGGSLAGKHLDFTPRHDPSIFLTQFPGLHSMMDISDGLAKDLPRLAKASNVGFTLDREAIPCTPGCGVHEALTDGEDYELLVTMSPDTFKQVMEAWPFSPIELTKIGTIVDPDKGESLKGGWDPFQS